MKIYISGPMTGYKNHNIEAFKRAEKYLREIFPDAEIVNPADNQGKCNTWVEYMKLDIKQLLECDSIYMLLGWNASNGANLELEIAQNLDFKIMYQKY